jgi:hypothetical protein
MESQKTNMEFNSVPSLDKTIIDQIKTLPFATLAGINRK